MPRKLHHHAAAATAAGFPTELLRDQTGKAIAVLLVSFSLYLEGFARNWEGDWERIYLGSYLLSDEELRACLIAEGRSEVELSRLTRDDLVLEKIGHLGPEEMIRTMIADTEGADALKLLDGYLVESARQAGSPARSLFIHFLTYQKVVFERYRMGDFPSDHLVFVPTR